ncbi:MAG: OmpA family protein [Bdellovibrionaceae bacterium]|nr:OmpA family protein [Pseudobdellovibrionaceae bacterium]
MTRREKSRRDDHENHERWLVSYADFITLLFAFFVVMYATSSRNQEKEKKFEDSVKQSLRILAISSGGEKTFDQVAPEILQPFVEFPRNGSPAEIEDYLRRVIDKKWSEEHKSRLTKLRHDRVGARISLAASSFFDQGSAKLRPEGLSTLDKVALLLSETDAKLVVEGHTDDRPVIGGRFPSNWELASARATTVVRYLIQVHKIDPSRLAAMSYADQKPIAPNDTEENRAKNRRIEILIINQEPEG